ncbi:MAG: type II secretion system F family protein [Bacillota bacterium]|nr:type II secretion system F family protein [Bacillota bacterium]
MTGERPVRQFAYRAAGMDGRVVRGQLSAEDLGTARLRLREQGLFPLSLREARNGAGAVPAGAGPWVTAFTRHLADLLESGLDLDRALGALGRMAPPRWQPLLLAVRAEVQSGAGLAGALSRFPRLFPPDYTGLVRAGEAAGNLEAVLRRLAAYREEEEEVRRFVRTALVYPAVVAAASVLSAGVMLGFVVPRFAALFRQFHRALPWPTRVVVGIGSALAGRWPVWLLVLGAAGLAGWIWVRSPGGRAALGRLAERLPGVGTIRHHLAVARLARSAAMLLGSGLTLSRALAVLTEAEASPGLRRVLAEAHERVESGRPLAATLAEQAFFPALAVEMVAVGEEAGNLETAFSRVAEVYGTEARERTRRLLALVEPALILGVAGLVALVVAAMLLPVLSLPALEF